MADRYLNQEKSLAQMITGSFIENGNDNSILQIVYEIDGQQYTLDLAKLSDLTNPQGSGYYWLENKKYIHFFDVSSSDLHQIWGVCAFLNHGMAPISLACYDYDPCLMMGLIVNDNGGPSPVLHDCGYFVQGRNILKMLLGLGYAKRYEILIEDFKDYLQKCGENKENIISEIWPEYTGREPGSFSVLCVDQAFRKDKLLLCKIDSYFMALDKDYQTVNEGLPEETLFFDRDCQFKNPKYYFLQDSIDHPYISATPGKFGGHYKLKIYGRLDCPSANRYIAKGQYVKHRVFFKDEETAIAAGYRPCAVCMPEAYKYWKNGKKLKSQNLQIT